VCFRNTFEEVSGDLIGGNSPFRWGLEQAASNKTNTQVMITLVMLSPVTVLNVFARPWETCMIV
jgi:hypothetical protein